MLVLAVVALDNDSTRVDNVCSSEKQIKCRDKAGLGGKNNA